MEALQSIRLTKKRNNRTLYIAGTICATVGIIAAILIIVLLKTRSTPVLTAKHLYVTHMPFIANLKTTDMEYIPRKDKIIQRLLSKQYSSTKHPTPTSLNSGNILYTFSTSTTLTAVKTTKASETVAKTQKTSVILSMLSTKAKHTLTKSSLESVNKSIPWHKSMKPTSLSSTTMLKSSGNQIVASGNLLGVLFQNNFNSLFAEKFCKPTMCKNEQAKLNDLIEDILTDFYDFSLIREIKCKLGERLNKKKSSQGLCSYYTTDTFKQIPKIDWNKENIVAIDIYQGMLTQLQFGMAKVYVNERLRGRNTDDILKVLTGARYLNKRFERVKKDFLACKCLLDNELKAPSPYIQTYDNLIAKGYPKMKSEFIILEQFEKMNRIMIKDFFKRQKCLNLNDRS